MKLYVQPPQVFTEPQKCGLDLASMLIQYVSHQRSEIGKLAKNYKFGCLPPMLNHDIGCNVPVQCAVCQIKFRIIYVISISCIMGVRDLCDILHRSSRAECNYLSP